MLMQTPLENEALNTINLIVTGAVTVIVAWLSVQRTKDKRQADVRHAEAVAERGYVAAKTEEVLTSVTPKNGYGTMGEALEGVEKRVGQLAERLARGDARFDSMEQSERRLAELLNVISHLTESISERLEDGDEQFRRIEAKQAETLAQHAEARADMRKIADTLERLRAGFERDDPLRRRAVAEWGHDGKRGKKKP